MIITIKDHKAQPARMFIKESVGLCHICALSFKEIKREFVIPINLNVLLFNITLNYN